MERKVFLNKTLRSFGSISSGAELIEGKPEQDPRSSYTSAGLLVLLVCEKDQIAFPVLESTLAKNSPVFDELLKSIPKGKPRRINMGNVPTHAIKRMLSYLSCRAYEDDNVPDVPFESIRPVKRRQSKAKKCDEGWDERRATMPSMPNPKSQAINSDLALLYNNLDVWFLATQYSVHYLHQTAVQFFRHRLREAGQEFWGKADTVAAIISAIYDNVDSNSLRKRRELRYALVEELVNYHISSNVVILPGVEDKLREQPEFAIDYAYYQQQRLKKSDSLTKVLSDQLKQEHGHKTTLSRSLDHYKDLENQLASTRLNLAIEKGRNDTLQYRQKSWERTLIGDQEGDGEAASR